jgi:surface protein
VTAWIGGDATTYGNIVEWNTAAVTSMASLFNYKSTFNGDISKWNTSSATNMQQMFYQATAFNHPRIATQFSERTRWLGVFKGEFLFCSGRWRIPLLESGRIQRGATVLARCGLVRPLNGRSHPNWLTRRLSCIRHSGCFSRNLMVSPASSTPASPM